MNLILRCLLAAVLLLVLGIPFAVWLAFDEVPLLKPAPQVAHTDVERARRLLERYDPRKGAAGALRHVALPQADLDVLLNEAARRIGQASARAVLGEGSMALQASVRVARSPIGTWINVDALLLQGDGLPKVEHLRIGRLPVPGWLADWALTHALQRLNSTEPGRLANDMVRSVSFAPTGLRVAYAWRDDLVARLRSAVLPPDDVERLRVYNGRLAEAVARLPASTGVSLARLLPPLFELARQRSQGTAGPPQGSLTPSGGGLGAARPWGLSDGGDAARENRAAIITLAFYANGRGLVALTPAARDWPAPAARTVTLAGRDDFPKHFLISAALAAEAGGALADAIGVYKEVDDARAGSGFSFNDIAADRAGTRFGELALRAPERLQAALAGAVAEPDFMPDVHDLPEFMPEAEFKRRFGAVGAPAYQKMMAEIEARIAARPLHR